MILLKKRPAFSTCKVDSCYHKISKAALAVQYYNLLSHIYSVVVGYMDWLAQIYPGKNGPQNNYDNMHATFKEKKRQRFLFSKFVHIII